MASMIEKLDYTEEPGSHFDHKLTLYSLSTCAFCKKAIDFLKSQDVGFRYIQLDTINPMVKQTVKSELRSKYDNLPVFPILVIDDKEAISGFNEARWKSALDLS